jgi:RimJ/RimL family protein N-acetyltransferase
MNTGVYGLEIVIETERTVIRSVTKQDTALYQALFADAEVMARYVDGRPRNTKTDQDAIAKRIEDWVSRWASLPNNEKGTTFDPYNGMAIFEKATGEFIGHIVLGRSDKAGILECATLNHKAFWDQGIGKEIAGAMQELMPALLAAGYTLDGAPVTGIMGTARVEHTASQKLMEGAGMVTDGKVEKKYDANRHHFIRNFSLGVPCQTLSPV